MRHFMYALALGCFGAAIGGAAAGATQVAMAACVAFVVLGLTILRGEE